jgi:hypothetical protein
MSGLYTTAWHWTKSNVDIGYWAMVRGLTGYIILDMVLVRLTYTIELPT